MKNEKWRDNVILMSTTTKLEILRKNTRVHLQYVELNLLVFSQTSQEEDEFNQISILFLIQSKNIHIYTVDILRKHTTSSDSHSL